VAGSTAEGGKNRPNPAALAVDDALATLDSSAMVAVFQSGNAFTLHCRAPCATQRARRKAFCENCADGEEGNFFQVPDFSGGPDRTRICDLYRVKVAL
jgi:hypothetical protein